MRAVNTFLQPLFVPLRYIKVKLNHTATAALK